MCYIIFLQNLLDSNFWTRYSFINVHVTCSRDTITLKYFAGIAGYSGAIFSMPNMASMTLKLSKNIAHNHFIFEHGNFNITSTPKIKSFR